ncbi:hypothetical protein TWF718_010190 [Orbilia javanica]|uniref:Uncharacterized protein n=1 Tax=Orbilia javanica TaxID=47235 RepID=A0AAN8MHL9_9PEZI
MICGHNKTFCDWAHSSSRLFLSTLLSWVESDIDYSDDGTELKELCGCLVDTELSSDAQDSRLQNGGESIVNANPQSTIIKLAHFTVQEYLESEHIKDSDVKFFALSSSSTVTDFSLNIMRRVSSINPDLLHELYISRRAAGDIDDLPWNSDHYLINFAFYLITTIYCFPGFEDLDLSTEDGREILQLILKFLHPDSAPVLFLKRPPAERGCSEEIELQANFMESYDYQHFSSQSSGLIFCREDERVLTSTTAYLKILWKLLGVYNVRLGLEVLELLDEQERRKLLTENTKIRVGYDLDSSDNWEPSLPEPFEASGTLPEIFAESQFLTNSSSQSKYSINRLRFLTERFGNLLNLTNLLNCYSYSHSKNCGVGSDDVPPDTLSCLFEKLLREGANPNGGGMLMTPLQVAAQCWDFEAIKLLLDHEADVNAIGVEGGRTCLGWQSEYATWSPLRIYRRDIALFKPSYNFKCFDTEHREHRLLLHHKIFLCRTCGNPDAQGYDHKRYIESRHLDVEMRAKIEQLLISKGAIEF